MDYGSLISTGASVGSSLYDMFGKGGSSDQSAMSKQLLKLMTAGIDDGNGNTVIYDKKSNTFRTVLNPTNRASAKASDMEGLMRLTTELPRERQERYENSLGRSGDRQLANTLRNKMVTADANRMTPARLEGDMYTANAEGINDAFKKVGGNVAATGLRTHQSGDTAITNLAQTLAKNLGTARVQARLGAKQGADQINQSHIGELAGEYGAENASANNIDNTPYNPFTLNTQMAGLASSQKAQIPQLAYTALSAGKSGATSGADDIFDIGQNFGTLMNGFNKPGQNGFTLPTALQSTNSSSGLLGNQAYRAGF